MWNRHLVKKNILNTKEKKRNINLPFHQPAVVEVWNLGAETDTLASLAASAFVVAAVVAVSAVSS